MRRFAIGMLTIGALLLGACSTPSRVAAHPSPTRDSGIHCADVIAQAMTSPDAVVAGATLCLDLTATTQLAGLTPPILSDAGFQAYAQTDPVVTQYQYRQTVHGPGVDVIVYRLSNPTTNVAVCMGVFLQTPAPKSGADNRQVDQIHFLAVSSRAC